MTIDEWIAACTAIHRQYDAATRPAWRVYANGYAAAERERDEALRLAEKEDARRQIKTAFNRQIDDLRHELHVATGPAWRESDAAILTVDAEYRASLAADGLLPVHVAAQLPAQDEA